MLNRVANLLPLDAQRTWGGTFHSVETASCGRHGARSATRAGSASWIAEDQKDLIQYGGGQCGIDPKEIRFPKGEVLAEIFSFCCQHGEAPGGIARREISLFPAATRQNQDVQERYGKKKKGHELMDFRRSAAKDDVHVSAARALADLLSAAVSIHSRSMNNQDTEQDQADLSTCSRATIAT
jgi:DNA helicase-2/ATP-dependent DNA helicase PcrA